MKIQVSRLRSILEQSQVERNAIDVLGELREGLNGAYRQLRELLTTFRLKIEGDGLASALRKTVAEFSARGNLTIDFAFHLAGCDLSPNEEIHVLQIVREALANVVHHARATRANVTVECAAKQTVTVTVDDDGVGIDHRPATLHHHGLTIMQERARSLAGTLAVREKALGGTRVTLQFTPACFRQSSALPGALNA